MTNLSYTSGDPANVVASSTVDMSDISGAFADIQTYFNAASIDAANLATSAKPVTLLGAYRTIAEATHKVQGGSTSGVYVPTLGISLASGGSALSSAPPCVIRWSASDHSVADRTTKLRISASLVTNATAPAANFTFGLYPVTFAGGAGVLVPTAGSVVSGSTVARNTPSASTAYQNATSDFTPPTDGAHILGVSLSTTLAANCYVAMTVRLEVRHV